MEGKIICFNTRGFGQILVRAGKEMHRYYFHIANVKILAEELKEPMVGCQVKFDVSENLRRKPNDLASAINVEVGLPLTEMVARAAL
jgi:hypothetical protein